jgi:hypothetical protein
MKKAGTTPLDCLEGLRILKIVRKIGIDVEYVQYFLNDLYNKCIEENIFPQDFARVIKEINSVPEIKTESLSEIASTITRLRGEKIDLEIEINKRTARINYLNNKITSIEAKLQDLQKEEGSFKHKIQGQEKDFLLFKDLKIELQKNNIPIQDIKSFINIIRIFRDDFNFSPQKVLEGFSTIQNYELYLWKKDEEARAKNIVIKNLDICLADYKVQIAPYQKIELALMDLENMEFDLSDLQKIYSVIRDIADETSTDPKQVKDMLFRLLAEYHDIARLEKDRLDKQAENSSLNDQIKYNRDTLKDQPRLFSILEQFIKIGLNENHIMTMISILISDLQNTEHTNNKEYVEDLLKELAHVKTLKNARKNLQLKIESEQSQLDQLQGHKVKIEEFIYFSIISLYLYYVMLKFQHIQTQNKLTQIFVLEYIYFIYLFCLTVTNKHPNHSKKRNKNGKKSAVRRKNKKN